MFRKQVVDNHQIKLYGNIIIPIPVAAKWIAVVLLTFIFCISLLLILGEFSRRVSVNGYITPTEGLLRIKPSSSGFIQQIKVNEGQNIHQGQVLFDVAKQTELLSGEYLNEALRQQLLHKKRLSKDRIEDQKRIHRLNLEEKDRQITHLGAQIHLLNNQHGLLKQQLSFALIQLERTRELFKSNMSTKAKLEQQQVYKLQIAQQISELKLRIASAKDSLNNTKLGKEKAELQHADILNQINSSVITIEQQLTELSGNGTQIITAPAAGTITKINIKANDLVQANQAAMHLLPLHSKLQAELLVPPEAIGFIQEGQEVKLRLSAFPYQKFGLQHGYINSIPQTPSTADELTDRAYSFQGSVYVVTVTLEQQFVTAFNKQLNLKPGMTLQADIKLAPRALWEWLLEPLLSLQGRFA